jgi:hypothetical protein
MRAEPRKSLPALKHAGFSSTTILPGESASEFERLHQALIAELNPDGSLEDEIVLSIAHYLWRQKNLGIFLNAERAQQRVNKIRDALVGSLTGVASKSEEPREFEKTFKRRWQAAEDQAREELGEFYDLAEMGEDATLEGLAKRLAIQERLDAAIDRCLRRLLFVRGLKSLPSPPNRAPQQRLSGPSSD